MRTFLFHTILQWRINMRNKEILVVYYIVPLIFYIFMGAVFTSITPEIKEQLIPIMVIFGVTMGGILGTPTTCAELYIKDIRKSYQVGNIPIWVPAIVNAISGFIHLSIMSILICLTAPVLFDAQVPQNLGMCIVILFLYIITCLIIGTSYGLYIKNTAKLNMAGQLIFLPSIMLSGIMFPSNLLPEFLQYIGKVLPATWSFEAIQNHDAFMWISLLIALCIILSILNIMKLKQLRTIE